MERILEIDGWMSHLCFSAAHLVVNHPTCGRLHGHTYAVHIRVTGELDDQGFIIDLHTLKALVREIINKLDHRVLLPTTDSISKEGDVVLVELTKKKYVLPVEDCLILPCPSLSVEYLAEYILSEIMKKFSLPKNILKIMVGVDEGPGQGAWVENKL